jgi:uncharacterized peroxidase-related enzyme
MTFIKTILKEEAQSPLKELYQEIEDTIGIKKIPNAFISSSIDPEITRWIWQGMKTILLRESSISSSLKESIALVVSKNNACSYCVGVHNMMLKAIGFDSKKIEELNKDYQSSSLSEKEKAVLDFSLKVTNESYKITEKDHENLKKHGMTEQQILEVISIASLLNFINRFVDALGTDLEIV